jgi:aldehyde:ferredoxin oxidoreductase
LVTDMLNAAYSTNHGSKFLAELGRRVIALEREFNHRAGLTQAADRLPPFFQTEPLPPHGSVFDVPDEQLDGMWEGLGRDD